MLKIADILFQATDLRTAQVKVFVEWQDRPLSAASWVLKSLNQDATQWWNLQKEGRYPQFKQHMFPKLAISGSPEDHLSDLDCSTISESPAYLTASSDED